MTTTRQNYIERQWVEGESTLENRNPSHLGEVIRLYAQAFSVPLEQTLAAANSSTPL